MNCITTTTKIYYAVVMNLGGVINKKLYRLEKTKSQCGDISWCDSCNCVKFSYGDNMKIGLNKVDNKYWIYIDNDEMMAMQFLYGATSACDFLKGIL